MPVAYPAVSNVEHRRDAGRRQLVQAILSAKQLGPHTTSGEHLGHERQHPVVAATHDLCERPSRVRERTEEVEHRRYAELATYGRRVRGCGVESGREHEPDPRAGKASFDAVRA